MDENFLELFRSFRESQNRYVYFLLAAAAAALGFALRETAGTSLSYTQIPLGISVLFWGASFFCGCKWVAYLNSSTYSNMDLLLVESGRHPKLPNNPAAIAAASQGIRDAMEQNSKKAGMYAKWQFNLLIWGAVLYVAWHVLNMYILTFTH